MGEVLRPASPNWLKSYWPLYLAAVGLSIFAVQNPFLGVTSIVDFFWRTGSPTWPEQAVLFEAVYQTAFMAIVGTSLGFMIALILAAEITVTTNRSLKSLLSIPVLGLRGLPDLVAALIISQIIGIGIVAGTVAIALGTVGVSTKLIANIFNRNPRDGRLWLEQAGNGKRRAFFIGELPQHLIELKAQFFFRLEINFRIATIIGIAGGGGLGLLLRINLGQFDFPAATAIILVLAAVILLTELLTRFAVRSRTRSSSSARLRSSSWNLAFPVFWLAVSALLILGAQQTSEVRFDLAQASRTLVLLAQPDFISQGIPLVQGLLETLVMALLGSLVAFPVAVILGALASSAITGPRGLRIFFRLTLGALRSIPTAVLGLILVFEMGLGFETGLLALSLGSTLFLSRIFRDAFDSKATSRVDSFVRIGARSHQGLVAVMRGQLRSRLLELALFTIDFNLRYTVVLGLIGAGGLGTVISSALRVMDLPTASAATLIIILLLFGLEVLSNRLPSAARPGVSRMQP